MSAIRSITVGLLAAAALVIAGPAVATATAATASDTLTTAEYTPLGPPWGP